MSDEINWSKVFDVRCRSKRGERLTPEEQEFCRRAYEADPKRYAAMNADVFNETVPAGSTARAKWR